MERKDSKDRLDYSHGLLWLNLKTGVGLVLRLTKQEVPSWKSSEGLRLGDPIWFFTKIFKLLSSFYQHLYLFLLFFFITLSSYSICNDMITYGKIYVQQPPLTLHPFRKKNHHLSLDSSTLFCSGIFFSFWVAFCSKLHNHSSIEESRGASQRWCSPHLEVLQACEAMKASSELNDIENITTAIIQLQHQDQPLPPLWQTEEMKTCTSETAKMDLQDDLLSPSYLPSTGDMFSEPVGQLDPESTLIDQVRHDCGALKNGSTLWWPR